MGGELTMEPAAMPIRPIHHGRNRNVGSRSHARSIMGLADISITENGQAGATAAPVETLVSIRRSAEALD